VWPNGSGQFIKDLRETFGTDDKLLTSEVPNRGSWLHRSRVT